MYYFICLCLIVYIVGGNALSITLLGTTFKIGELLFIVLGFGFVPKMFTNRLSKTLKYLLYWSILSLFLIIINTFIYNFSVRQSLVAFMYLFRFIFIIFTAYQVSIYLKSIGKVYRALKLINLCYIIVCFIGFFQLIFYPVANDWYALFTKIGVNWYGDPHINRLVSTDFDPNYLACCLLIGITINLYFLSKNKEKKLVNLLYLLIYLISILLTKSRSGILGVAVVLVLYWCLSINLKKIKLRDALICLGIIFIGGYLFLFSNITVFVRIRTMFSDPSAMARFNSWSKSFEIILNTKFLGIGYNYYGAYNELMYGTAHSNSSAGVDSSLLMLLITTGLLGFVLYIIHFISAFKKVKHKAIKSLMLATIIICNFNNLIFYSLFLLPFYLLYFNVIVEENNYSLCKVTNKNRVLVINNCRKKCL